jgi:hypothetical protein
VNTTFGFHKSWDSLYGLSNCDIFKGTRTIGLDILICGNNVSGDLLCALHFEALDIPLIPRFIMLM